MAHIVFLEGMGAGHINPTVPLIAAFVNQGCKVTYFACAESPHAPSKDDLVSKDTSLGQAGGGSLSEKGREHRWTAERRKASSEPRQWDSRSMTISGSTQRRKHLRGRMESHAITRYQA